MKTLYVHIGTPKTATKAIQNFCWENPKALEKYGYCYPDLHDLCPWCTKVKNGHFLVNPFAIEDKEERQRAEQELYRMGMDRVIALFSVYDNIILSDEGIYRDTYKRRRSLWQELKEDGERHGFHVKIVVYLRRQDDWLVSVWNQNVKQGAESVTRRTWEEFVSQQGEGRQLDYFKKLESISEVLGTDHVIVRRYQPGTFYGGTIYDDFLHSVGLDLTEEFEISKEERNLSLTGNTQEIMRIINGVSRLDEDDMNFIRNILHKDEQISRESYPSCLFSVRERKKILTTYRRSNRLVAGKYLGEQAGSDLFPETVPDVPKWRPDNPYMQQDVIRFAALGMARLKEENKMLRSNYKKLRRELDELSQLVQQTAKSGQQ